MKHAVINIITILSLYSCSIHAPTQTTIQKAVHTTTQTDGSCKVEKFLDDKHSSFIKGGAVVVYEKKGGIDCVDEIIVLYPEGRIIIDSGGRKQKEQVTTEEVDQLLERINEIGWFKDYMFSVWMDNICPVCHGYLVTVFYRGRVKAITDADDIEGPANYWQVVESILSIIPGYSRDP